MSRDEAVMQTCEHELPFYTSAEYNPISIRFHGAVFALLLAPFCSATAKKNHEAP